MTDSSPRNGASNDEHLRPEVRQYGTRQGKPLARATDPVQRLFVEGVSVDSCCWADAQRDVWRDRIVVVIDRRVLGEFHPQASVDVPDRLVVLLIDVEARAREVRMDLATVAEVEDEVRFVVRGDVDDLVVQPEAGDDVRAHDGLVRLLVVDDVVRSLEARVVLREWGAVHLDSPDSAIPRDQRTVFAQHGGERVGDGA